MKFFCVLFAGICLMSCSDKGTTFTNPVRTTEGDPVAVADPFVYKYDGVYYMTGTTAEDRGFDYYTSTDLVNWEYKGPLFRKSENHYGVGAFWAPEVKYYKGKFYMTYSALDEECGFLLSSLAVSDKPEGPFRELYTPWFNLGYSAIDCHIFTDEDGTPYLYFSKNGSQDGYTYGQNYAVQLSADLSQFIGEPVLVGEASQEWEKVNYEKNRCNEGAFVIKRGNTYYMTYSANDTGYDKYGIGVATAQHPLGPWTKDEENPLMTTVESEGISSPGHNSIVESEGGKELLIIYHTHRDINEPKPNWNRVVHIDRLYFDKNGKLCVSP